MFRFAAVLCVALVAAGFVGACDPTLSPSFVSANFVGVSPFVFASPQFVGQPLLVGSPRFVSPGIGVGVSGVPGSTTIIQQQRRGLFGRRSSQQIIQQNGGGGGLAPNINAINGRR